jgi:signal transduction histidine kinase
MRESKAYGLVQKYLLPVLVLAFVVAFLFVCKSRVQTSFLEIYPEDGTADFRQIDFTHNVYHLVNRWDKFVGLYTPEDFSDPDTAPEKQTEWRADEPKGTMRLRILAQPDTYLSLCSFSMDYCTRIYVNGTEVRNIGFVSDDPEKAVPKVRYVTLPLYTGESGELEIIYQYNNYWHKDGGFIQRTLVSTPENIDEYQRGLTLYSLLLSSGLLFLMFYFLLSAAIQKNREYLALALCCLIIALRNQFFFAEHLLSGGYDFYLEYRIMVLDVSMIPGSALYLLSAFYRKAIGRRTMGVYWAVILILVVLHFVLRIIDLVALCHVSFYACGVILFWFAICMIRWFWREHRPEPLDWLTLAGLSLLTVTLIWEGAHSGTNSQINHFGVTPLAMIVCILVLSFVINSRISRQALLLQQAQERNETLSRVNEMNKDFLRMVAHELKTPLTVISGYAQLIGLQMERNSISEQTPERLKTIRSEADRLSEIVTRLMDYTYGGGADANMSAVEADELLRAAAAVMTPVCAKQRNTLRLESGYQGRIHGSIELLLQVLINLIVNASRACSDSEIIIRSEDAGAFAAFIVSDHGCGIPPEALPHIFEKGYTTTEGKGLGLAICRETVGMHGGTLELVSTGPEGSCFRFTVPKEDKK